MTDSFGVEKRGIHQQPWRQIRDSLELKGQFEHRDVYSNPLRVACPCCDEPFDQAIFSTGAWTITGAHAPLKVCIGDSDNGRIVFAHVEPDEE